MVFFSKKTKTEPDSSARKIGACLVLNLVTARRPIVWQYDLGTASRAAFEIDSAPANGFVLRLMIPDLPPQMIAEFDTREEALRILGDLQSVLGVGEGRARSCAAAPNRTHTLLMAGISFCLFCLLTGLFFSVVPSPLQKREGSSPAGIEAPSAPIADPATPTSVVPSSSDPEGMPQNADDILGK